MVGSRKSPDHDLIWIWSEYDPMPSDHGPFDSELEYIITFTTDGRLIANISEDDTMLDEQLPKCWTYG